MTSQLWENMWSDKNRTLTCVICFLTAYKCRCTRKGPKIRYKDVQKLEIKPKHPYCQEKMILWVTIEFFVILLLCHVCFCLLYLPLIYWHSLIFSLPFLESSPCPSFSSCSSFYYLLNYPTLLPVLTQVTHTAGDRHTFSCSCAFVVLQIAYRILAIWAR